MKVLIASPIRYRPECPEVLPAFLEALASLQWDGEREFYFEVDGTGASEQLDRLDLPYKVRHLFGSEDSRLMLGPRQTGEVQENIAFLRNKILRRFSESDADLLLMPDSDVILHPSALQVMADEMAKRPRPCTVSLQILNTPWVGGPPTGNATTQVRKDGNLIGYMPIPWAEDGSIVDVDRCGACTLYPREVLRFRFHWDPMYNEEHQSLFDQCKIHGWRHWLIRDPKLADHRMKRDPSIMAGMERLKAERRERRG